MPTQSGLALALAVLGSLVRSYSWCCALRRVEAVPAELLSRPAGDRLNRYESLWAYLQASQSSLDTTHCAKKHFLCLHSYFFLLFPSNPHRTTHASPVSHTFGAGRVKGKKSAPTSGRSGSGTVTPSSVW